MPAHASPRPTPSRRDQAENRTAVEDQDYEGCSELESKWRDLDEELAGLRALELDAKERLDRALIEEAKRHRSKK